MQLASDELGGLVGLAVGVDEARREVDVAEALGGVAELREHRLDGTTERRRGVEVGDDLDVAVCLPEEVARALGELAGEVAGDGLAEPDVVGEDVDEHTERGGKRDRDGGAEAAPAAAAPKFRRRDLIGGRLSSHGVRVSIGAPRARAPR